MRTIRREPNQLIVAAAALIAAVALAGCQSPEEKCNEARVVAHDALTGLTDLCTDYPDREWRAALREADGASLLSPATMFILNFGAVPEQTESACRALERARGAANGGALRARESAEASHQAIVDLRQAAETARARIADPAFGSGGRSNVREEALRTMSEHIDRVLSQDVVVAMDRVDSLTAASWDACQSVDP